MVVIQQHCIFSAVVYTRARCPSASVYASGLILASRESALVNKLVRCVWNLEALLKFRI